MQSFFLHAEVEMTEKCLPPFCPDTLKMGNSTILP